MTCLRVHAGLDDLQRHLAADGLRLLGHVDDAHAALADLFPELVGADHRAGAFRDPSRAVLDRRAECRRLQEAAPLGPCVEQPLHLPPQVGVFPTGFGQVGGGAAGSSYSTAAK